MSSSRGSGAPSGQRRCRSLRRAQLAVTLAIGAQNVSYILAFEGATGQLLVPLLVLSGAALSAWLAASGLAGSGLLAVAWPVLWWPGLYLASVQAVQVNPDRYIDVHLAAWDGHLFQRGVVLTPGWSLGGPTEELANLLYASFYAVVPGALLWAWSRRGEELALRFGLGLLLSFAACSLAWLVWPAGGYHATGSPLTEGWGPFTGLVRTLYAANPHYAAAFPSSHVAISVGMASMLIRSGQTRLWWLWAAGVSWSTVYGQYHYAVDAPPAWLVGAVAGALAWSDPERWPAPRRLAGGWRPLG